jgi:hypothetical protein
MKTVDEKRRVELDKAIAYFMGWRIDNSFPDKGKIWRRGNALEVETTFKFSTDWNYIMELYEAINNIQDEIYPLGCTVIFDKSYCEVLAGGEVQFRAPHKEEPISMKEFVYRCMGEFIESYNEKKRKLNAPQ